MMGNPIEQQGYLRVANQKLRAENERLREALKEILKASDFIGSGVVDWRKWVEDAQVKARAALANPVLAKNRAEPTP